VPSPRSGSEPPGKNSGFLLCRIWQTYVFGCLPTRSLFLYFSKLSRAGLPLRAFFCPNSRPRCTARLLKVCYPIFPSPRDLFSFSCAPCGSWIPFQYSRRQTKSSHSLSERCPSGETFAPLPWCFIPIVKGPCFFPHFFSEDPAVDLARLFPSPFPFFPACGVPFPPPAASEVGGPAWEVESTSLYRRRFFEHHARRLRPW